MLYGLSLKQSFCEVLTRDCLIFNYLLRRMRKIIMHNKGGAANESVFNFPRARAMCRWCAAEIFLIGLRRREMQTPWHDGSGNGRYRRLI